MLLWLASASAWAQTVTIGSTTVPAASPATSSYFYGPLYRSANDIGSSFNYSRYAYLYTPAELGIPTGAVITQLEWLKADAGQVTGNNNYAVWLENSTRTTLGTTQTWAALSGTATPVYNSTTQQVTGAAGAYFGVTLNQPFVYTGGNLMILTDWTKLGSASAAVNFITNPAAGFGLGAANSSVLTGTTALTSTSYGDRRPTLRVTYAPGGPCTAPPTAGTVQASSNSVCAGSGVSFSLQGASYGQGMTYQWQSSTNGTTYTNIAGATTPTYSVAALTTSTYFRAVLTCSGQSATTPAVQVTVVAPTYATVPYTESFENTWLDACNTHDAPTASWRNNPSTGNSSWRRDDDGASAAWTSPTLGVYSPVFSQGARSARFHSYYAGAGAVGNLDLFINLSAAGNKFLSFDYVNSAGNDSLYVSLSTDGGATFGAPLLKLGNTGTAFAPQITSFSSTATNAVIRFSAKVTTTFTSDIGIDNLSVGILNGVPGCATNLAPVNNATGVQRPLTITWNPSTTGVTTGYDVYFGTTATPPLVSSNQSGTSYTPTINLAGNTTYYYQIVPRNANGPATSCGVTQFTTGSTFNYCSSGLGSYCGTADITTVAIAGTTLNNAGTTCAVNNGSGYTAYPATGSTTATLAAGTPYQLSVTASASAILSVWVDYNQNGSFEASEWQQIATSTTANAPTTITLNVPSNAAQGLTGLRIRSRSTSNPNGAGDACTLFGSGETEDYFVTIGPVPACPSAAGLTVSNITATTARIAFTAPAAGTSYTVTYTPQGGSATTVTPAPTASPVNLSGLTPGTTYTVGVTTNCAGGQTGVSTFITFRTAPGNDECSSSQLLTSGTTCTPTSGSLLLATQSASVPTCSLASPGTADDDVWYRFVATSTGHQIDVDELGNLDAVVQVFSGSCGSLTALQCVDASFSGGAEQLRVYGLTVGQTYYVRVYSFGSTAPTTADSDFTICVTTAPTPAPNDECTTATPLAVQFGTSCVSPLVANNINASASQVAPAPGCANYNGGDVWFSLVVPATGTVTLETGDVAGSPISDTGMAAYTGTCGNLTQLQCDDDSSPNGLYSQLTLTGLTPGSTIYVRVWEYGNDSFGQFTLCAVTPSNCAAPTAPGATVTSTSATLSWSGTPAANATYEVQYGPANFTLGNGTSVTGLTSNSTTINLAPDTEYCYYVRQNCGAVNGQSAWVGPTCFRTNVLPATNDEPCTAVAATVNQFGNLVGPINGTTVGATPTTVGGIGSTLPACSPALGPKDVWYRVTLPAGVTTINAVFSGNAAGMVRLYTAANCSTAFALVGCQASTGSNTAVGRVGFTGLTAGTTYYIAVSGFGTGDTPGPFSVATAKRNQLAGGQVDIYPNPVQGGSSLHVRLSGGKPGAVRCEVLNALGQVVLTRTMEARNGAVEQTLDTQGLAKGLYQVRLSIGSDVLVEKVLVD